MFFFYYIDIVITALKTIFPRFPTAYRRFPKISEDSPILSEGHTKVAEHISKIFEDSFRRFPKIAEDLRGRPEDVLIIHRRINVQFKRQTLFDSDGKTPLESRM